MVDYNRKRVTIAGLGHFGGNVAAARWLTERGATVVVTDKADAAKLAEPLAALAGLPIRYRLGGHDEADFTSADLIVASPAVAPSNPYLAAARAAGVPITTEICLFVRECPATVVGVTGTKGKSTTASMLAAMLVGTRTVWLGGNIGKSLLLDLPNIKPADVVVLELSSFMLEYLGAMQWSPAVALVTMLAPDHLDWHGSYEAYVAAKMNLLRFQKPGDVTLFNAESAELTRQVKALVGPAVPAEAPSAGTAGPASRTLGYTLDSAPPFALGVPGRHNQLNAQGAFAAARLMGVTWDAAQVALARFEALPHRLALVHEADGVRWYDDSIATVPEAAVAALQAFPPGTVVQIVGGSDKGLDIAPMVQPLAETAKAALCIGQTGQAVAAALRSAGATCVCECGTLEQAVAAARDIARPGDVVLLSTGFASYGQFDNFQQRGDRFAALARQPAKE